MGDSQEEYSLVVEDESSEDDEMEAESPGGRRNTFEAQDRCGSPREAPEEVSHTTPNPFIMQTHTVNQTKDNSTLNQGIGKRSTISDSEEECSLVVEDESSEDEEVSCKGKEAGEIASGDPGAKSCPVHPNNLQQSCTDHGQLRSRKRSYNQPGP